MNKWINSTPHQAVYICPLELTTSLAIVADVIELVKKSNPFNNKGTISYFIRPNKDGMELVVHSIKHGG